jgi:hypothetical protein
MIPHIIKMTSISLFPVGEAPIIIDGGHPNFEAVREALAEGRDDEAVELARIDLLLAKVSGGDVEVTDTGVSYKGMPINGYLTEKLLQFFAEGLPVEHYCLFLSNLMANPSMVSREELYLFLEGADLPITEDGCFLAYKSVRADFKDKYSGKFDNSPGVTHTMERREVDDNRDRTCSYGFHAAAYEYAKNFMSGGWDKMVAVKINPKDVVSVPADYRNQKLRCCKYTVLYEVPGAADIFKGRAHVSAPTKGTGVEASQLSPVNMFWGAIWSDDEDDNG